MAYSFAFLIILPNWTRGRTCRAASPRARGRGRVGRRCRQRRLTRPVAISWTREGSQPLSGAVLRYHRQNDQTMGYCHLGPSPALKVSHPGRGVKEVRLSGFGPRAACPTSQHYYFEGVRTFEHFGHTGKHGCTQALLRLSFLTATMS